MQLNGRGRSVLRFERKVGPLSRNTRARPRALARPLNARARRRRSSSVKRTDRFFTRQDGTLEHGRIIITPPSPSPLPVLVAAEVLVFAHLFPTTGSSCGSVNVVVVIVVVVLVVAIDCVAAVLVPVLCAATVGVR
ncbi:hypothetical protein HPB47_011193 [Ixodes persulcatus]|uniref:Uncharacterized protein n=1 Tax=Ixodes persulcatus TaxID=34615 RepID=A0AC60NX34_IXOPE|nr:hypothetical protein HPB47_011193 [Ixodes persulcatus]